MTQQPTTIEEVLTALDSIINDAIQHQNPKGYFAALYRAVTAKVKEGIAQGRFEDGARMEKLDVIFANRYLAAHDAYFSQKSCTQSWKLAFNEIKNDKLLILHHLFLGMTAHIMLDLGIAAAETCPQNEIHKLEKDFKEINLLLSSMVDGIEAKLSILSPSFFLVDFFGGKMDEKLADFSMKIARTVAWQNALKLAPLHRTAKWETQIHQIDTASLLFAKTLIPRGIAKYNTRLVRYWEEKNISKAIAVLQ